MCYVVQAISASMSEGDLTATSCTVGFVGADSSFTILSDADLEPHVAALKDAEDAPAGVNDPLCAGGILTDATAWQLPPLQNMFALAIVIRYVSWCCLALTVWLMSLPGCCVLCCLCSMCVTSPSMQHVSHLANLLTVHLQMRKLPMGAMLMVVQLQWKADRPALAGVINLI